MTWGILTDFANAQSSQNSEDPDLNEKGCSADSCRKDDLGAKSDDKGNKRSRGDNRRNQTAGRSSETRKGKQKGSPGVGLTTSTTSDGTSATIPIESPTLWIVGFDAEVPVYSLNGDTFLGHSRVFLSLRINLFDVLRVKFLGGGRFETGDTEQLGNIATPWPSIAANGSLDLHYLRLYGSYDKEERPKDDDEFDAGDTTQTFAGFDISLFGLESVMLYLASYRNVTTSAIYLDEYLDNGYEFIDSLGGIVIVPWNIRLGASIPVKTETNDEDLQDRETSVDVGFRYYL